MRIRQFKQLSESALLFLTGLAVMMFEIILGHAIQFPGTSPAPPRKFFFIDRARHFGEFDLRHSGAGSPTPISGCRRERGYILLGSRKARVPSMWFQRRKYIQNRRETSSFLISAMAFAGFRFFGQVFEQFMMV